MSDGTSGGTKAAAGAGECMAAGAAAMKGFSQFSDAMRQMEYDVVSTTAAVGLSNKPMGPAFEVVLGGQAVKLHVLGLRRSAGWLQKHLGTINRAEKAYELADTAATRAQEAEGEEAEAAGLASIEAQRELFGVIGELMDALLGYLMLCGVTREERGRVDATATAEEMGAAMKTIIDRVMSVWRKMSADPVAEHLAGRDVVKAEV